MSNHDPVDHPSHYTQGAVECIDAIEAALGEEGFIAFLRGQIMKYTWRLGLKGAAEEDAGKIAWYADRLEHVLAGRACTPDYVGDMVDAYGKARQKEIDQDIWDAAVQMRRDWKPITAEGVKRLRDVARSAEPPARDQFRVQYNSVTFKDDVRPRYATRVYDLDGNMRLTYPPFEFNWDAVESGNDWVAMDPQSGHVYSYSWKPVYLPSTREWWLPADAPDEADVFFETCLQDALPDGVFLIERVRLDG